MTQRRENKPVKRGRSAGPTRAKRPRPRPGVIDAGRDAVCAWLGRQTAKWPELDLRPFEAPAGLAARDAALAHAIADGVVRRWLTLEYLIERQTGRPLAGMQLALQGALLAGAAQVYLLDRVPAYAAIDHAVEFAKRHVRAGAGDLANAVLRRLADLRGERRAEAWDDRRDALPMEDGGVVMLNEAALPEEPAARLGVATSHPRELLEAWSSRQDAATVRRLAMHSLMTAPTTLNVAHAEAPLDEAVSRPHAMAHARVFTGTREQLLALMAARRDVWVQDAASALAAMSLRGMEPRVVVDLCAGQGTKTRQLAAIFPDARIIAADTDDRRLETLQETFAGQERVEVMEFGAAAGACRGEADLVLLDVPCSNTGVLARRPEAKYRFGGRSMTNLVKLQRRIVDAALPMLRPISGVVAYSTCSIDPRENEEQVEWMRGERGLRAGQVDALLPGGQPGEGPEGYHDGAFCAVMRQE